MTRWLNGSTVNEGQGTNYLRLTMNTKTFEEKYRGIVAHVPNTPGIMLNYCPFCGSDILNYPRKEED